MFDKAEEFGASIVVVGAFAPRTFHPKWFESYNLLPKAEAQDAVSEKTFVIVENLANFKAGSIDIQITQDRFQVLTTREDFFDPLSDLIQGTFSILDHSLINAIGFNWHVHYKTGSETAWHGVGDRLTPKKIWKEIWPKHVGMQDVTMKMQRNDDFDGHVAVSIQPSARLQHGVYIGINDHIDFSKRESFRAADLAEFVKTEWTGARKRGTTLLESVYSGVSKDDTK